MSLDRFLEKHLPWLILALIAVLVAFAAAGCSSVAPPAGPQAVAYCSAGEEEGYCDFGTAVPLAAWPAGPGRYLAPVAVLGAKTAGAGLALGVGETENLVWGVGAGWACPWGLESGLQTDEGAIVAGVTVSLTRNQKEE